MLDEAKEKRWKKGERNVQKQARKIVLLGGCEEKRCSLLKWHFRKIGKHYLCSEGTSFWKMVLFWCPLKVTNHYKNRGFSRHMGKPKMALLVAKVPFWEGPGKGLYYLWYLQAVLCWKHYFYSVHSGTQLCRNKRVQLEKQEHLPKEGVFAKMQKGVFSFVFLVVWWFCFFFVCFISLFWKKKKTKKAIFLQF